MAFILNLSNSSYLSGAFLVNDSCFRTGPPCLCLCISFRLAVFLPNLGYASASLNAFTAAVTAWDSHLVDY